MKKKKKNFFMKKYLCRETNIFEIERRFYTIIFFLQIYTYFEWNILDPIITIAINISYILHLLLRYINIPHFSGLFVAVSRKIRRHAKGKRPKKDAATPVESLEYRGSQHRAALPGRTCA